MLRSKPDKPKAAPVDTPNIAMLTDTGQLNQDLSKLALQVNGTIATAQGTSDAFNVISPQIRQLILNLESARRENEALHKEVERLKEALNQPRPKKP